MVQLQLTLAQEPDGSLNILNLLSSAQPANPAVTGSPFALEIDSLHIRDGELTLQLLPSQVPRSSSVYRHT